MNYKIVIPTSAFIVVTLVVVFSYLKTSQSDLGQLSVGNEVRFATTTKNVADNETTNWKTFINERDGYVVKYPGEEISGKPVIGSMMDELKEYGFLSSLTFQKYGGWASIYIYDGQINDAIEASKKIDKENRVYRDLKNTKIGGVNVKVLVWTNKLDTKNTENKSYFVQDDNRPDVTLYISGTEDFVKSIKFIDFKKYSLEIDYLGDDGLTPKYGVYVKSTADGQRKIVANYVSQCQKTDPHTNDGGLGYVVSEVDCWYGGAGDIFIIDFDNGKFVVKSKELDEMNDSAKFKTLFALD